MGAVAALALSQNRPSCPPRGRPPSLGRIMTTRPVQPRRGRRGDSGRRAHARPRAIGASPAQLGARPHPAECARCVARRMPFSTRPSTYRIELAATGRASCRRCRRAVGKGEVRIAITAFVRPGRSTLLYRCARPACIDAAFASAVLAVYCTASRVPAAQGVSDEDAARVRVTLENAASCDALARKVVLTAQSGRVVLRQSRINSLHVRNHAPRARV